MKTTTSNLQNDNQLQKSSFISVNPATETLIQEFQSLTRAELSQALAESKQAYLAWKDQTFSFRKNCILQLTTKLEERTESLASLITNEMGKPITQSIAEIKKCIWLCKYYAENAASLLEPKVIETEAEKSYVRYEPIGAVLGIMPWNFPFWQALRFAVPSLLAGNVVLLKPAPNVSLCGLAIAEIFQEIIPEMAIFQCLLAEVEDVAFLLKQPLIQGVAFTGSDRAGAQIASLAGKEIKQSILELGGSDAFLVLSDADLALAAKMGAKSRMNNSGQTCISAKRFIVEASVVETFLALLKKEILALKIGDPLAPTTKVSTLARKDLQLNLVEQLKDAVDQGAQPYLNGGLRKGLGYYFDPVILTEVTPKMRAYHEELFGPVAVVYAVEDEAAAIALANDTAYGLGAAVFSADRGQAERVATQLEVGAVAVNNLLSSDPRMPFGGVKRSGFGRELGLEGIRTFVNVKSVSVY